MWSLSEDSVMNRVLVAVATIATILGTATAAEAPTAIAGDKRLD
jgi:hypothetical protein